MRATPSTTVEVLIAERTLTSVELQRLTRRSQPWVSAQLKRLGERVVRLRTGRAVGYTLAHPAFGADDRIPVWTVDARGDGLWTLDVRPLAAGRFAVETAADSSRLWLGDSGDGLYADLPWFLQDLRPQGFVGRAVAKSLSAKGARFPDEPSAWTIDHVGRYLVANGDDLTGNLLVGQPAVSRVRRPPVARRSEDYPDIALEALQGETPGSSAGGEQPKFAVYSAERSAHVIVKFSPDGAERSGERWGDILVTEHAASRALREAGVPSGESRLSGAGGRLFLESDRFDRCGEHGRLSMFSLQTVDAEFVGDGTDWGRTMQGLHERDLVTREDRMTVDLLQAFGRCIGNTDMHLGNLGVAIDGDRFRLSPVYDMCSMCLAPTRTSPLPIARLSAWQDGEPDRAAASLDGSSRGVLLDLCRRFWTNVAGDRHGSDELRAFARGRARGV